MAAGTPRAADMCRPSIRAPTRMPARRGVGGPLARQQHKRQADWQAEAGARRQKHTQLEPNTPGNTTSELAQNHTHVRQALAAHREGGQREVSDAMAARSVVLRAGMLDLVHTAAPACA